MAVAGDQEVHAHAVELSIEAALVAAGEVGQTDLPICVALRHLLQSPGLVLAPELHEPLVARIHVGGTPDRSTCGSWGVVLSAAHVVFWVLLGGLGIHGIAVDGEDIDGEARILDSHAVVWCRHDPSVAGPGVGNLLVPAVVELPASPVVVAKDADPGLVAEATALVDTLEDGIELMARGRGNAVHGGAAVLLDTSPVEVVPDVQDKVRVHQAGTRPEGIGNQDLRLRVDSWDEAAARDAVLPLVLSPIEASHKLVVGAEELRVCLVPTGAREDVGPRSLAAAVGDDPGPAAGSVAMRHALVGRVKGSIHATPIPDRKEVRRSALPHLQSRPLDAVVLEGRDWGPHQMLGGVLDGLGPGPQLELRHRALLRVPVALVVVGQGLLIPALGALSQADGERETESQLLRERHLGLQRISEHVTLRVITKRIACSWASNGGENNLLFAHCSGLCHPLYNALQP